MIFVAFFAGLIGVVAIALQLGPTDVQRWGYPGLFLIALLRSASVVIPVPGAGITFAGGAFLDSHFGIPAPILVGLTVAIAESIGEFTGYAAGLGGSRMLEGGRFYERVKSWVQRRAAVTIFAMSLFPSFVFDVAGLAAGATAVPVRTFYPAMLAGKIIRGITVATLGYYSVGAVEDWV
jgi:membrane protein DedA with SNARE-associated domain